MDALPTELLEIIFYYLEREQEFALGETCSRWRAIVQDRQRRESRGLGTNVGFAYYSIPCYLWACERGLPRHLQMSATYAGGFGDAALCEYLRKNMVTFDVIGAATWAVKFANNTTFSYIWENYKTLTSELMSVDIDDVVGISTAAANIYREESEEAYDGDIIKAAEAFQKERATGERMDIMVHNLKIMHGESFEVMPSELTVPATTSFTTDEDGTLLEEEIAKLDEFEENHEFDYTDYLTMTMRVKSFFENETDLVFLTIRYDNLELYKTMAETKHGLISTELCQMCIYHNSRRIFDFLQVDFANISNQDCLYMREFGGAYYYHTTTYGKIVINGWYDVAAKLDIARFNNLDWLICYLRGDRQLRELAVLHIEPMDICEIPFHEDVLGDEILPALDQIRDQIEIPVDSRYMLRRLAARLKNKNPKLHEWIYQEWHRRYHNNLVASQYM